jgi:HSP20 family molecular chaperone IbpA
MRHEMDHMFDRFEYGFMRLPTLFEAVNGLVAPKIDIREDATPITIEAELQGMKKDIAVTLSNGILTMKGVPAALAARLNRG